MSRHCNKCVTKPATFGSSPASASATSSQSCCSAHGPRRRCGWPPAQALGRGGARGVFAALLPELEAEVGFAQDSPRQHLPLDEHTFEVVQAAADANAGPAVRLGAAPHRAGKPGANGSHAERGARLAEHALDRLRFPMRLRAYVVRL